PGANDEPVAASDRVEIDDPENRIGIAAESRLDRKEPRPEEPSLLCGEGDEQERVPVGSASDERAGHAKHSFDAARVVDSTRASPNGIEMGRDDHGTRSISGKPRKDVPVPAAGEESPPRPQ